MQNRARRVHDDDAGIGRGILVDIVRANPRPADNPQFPGRRNRFRRDFGAAADDEAIVFADNCCQFVWLLWGFYVDLESRGDAGDLARAVQLLVSDDAGFITGSTLSINGGQHMY